MLGALPRDTELALPSGIFGLVQAANITDLPRADPPSRRAAGRHFDLDALLRCAALFAPETASDRPAALPPPGQRIALARDQAFSFVYPHVIEAGGGPALKSCPSPRLRTKPPPTETPISCWLPGGYPELHAALAGARNLPQNPSSALPRPARYMASAAATWCSARVSEDATGRRHAMSRRCSATGRVSPDANCISVIAAPAFRGERAGRRRHASFEATNFTMRR